MVKNILYVTTQITGTWRYFSWCSYPSIWYYRVQKKILSILNACNNIEVSIKFYPNDLMLNPNRVYLNSEFENLKLLEESLLSILKDKNFDLIITEASATTLLEILCTKSQVLCYFPKEYVRIDEDARRLLSKRVYLSDTESYYTQMLELLINESSKIADKELNDEFLFKFGLDSLSKRPVLAEKEYIHEIIKSC